MAISTHILISIIGLAYPAYFLFTYKKTNERIKTDDRYRLIDYKQTIFIFWLLTLLVLGNTLMDKSLHLNFFPTFNTAGIVVAVLIVVFIVLQIVTSKVSSIEKADDIKKKLKSNFYYLPKSKSELIWFNLLSLSAGICEEIIFRLFTFTYLLEHTNLIIAAILTNAIFALTHIGSGKQNIIGAFILGLLFTAVYYFCENIWLPVILHSAIDISIGFLGYYTHKVAASPVTDTIED